MVRTTHTEREGEAYPARGRGREGLLQRGAWGKRKGDGRPGATASSSSLNTDEVSSTHYQNDARQVLASVIDEDEDENINCPFSQK
jgi:hypothetical protein